jgi:hypothetical protein
MNSSLLSSSMLGLSIGFLKWNFLEEKEMECYHGIAIKKYSYNNVNLLEQWGDYKSQNLLAYVWERMVD